MASLLENLRKNLETPQQPANLAPQSTQAAKSLLATKLTGKAQSPLALGPEPQEAPTDEESALQQGKAQLASQSLDNRIKSQQLAQQSAEQEQAARIQKQQLDQQGQFKQDAALNQANQLWNNFQNSGKQLDSDQSIADLEQVGFMIRLNNKQYLDKLQNEAAKQGINNDQVFKEQYYTQAFQDEGDLFQDNLAFKKMMDSDERDFVKEMSSMDTNFALELAKQANKEANLGAYYSSIGNTLSGGLQAYNAYLSKSPKSATAPATSIAPEQNQIDYLP